MKCISILACGVIALGLAGCSSTAEGLNEDAANNVNSIKDAAKEVAPVELTMKIKSALVSNPITNGDGLSIDVDSTSGVVRLIGVVKTQAQKDEAEQIATTVMKQEKATQKLDNALLIKP